MRKDMLKDRNLAVNNTRLKNAKSIGCKNLKTNARGITLIALVITVVLNCLRSGRNKVSNLLKYKMILKNNLILENEGNLL